jgi:radical SAM superfamily enzyme YgiQ (UPF0313 family)
VKRLRLLIIHPCVGRRVGQKRYLKTWSMQPLPAAQVAAIARKTLGQGVDIDFIDDRIEPIDESRPADLVCLSIETYTARRCYQIAGAFRRRNVPVVMGGFHATLCPEEVLRYADAVVSGEAEECFPMLLEDFLQGGMKRHYQASGRAGIRVRPDRSIFDGKRYLPVGLVEYSRGCRFACDFCAVTAAFQATHRHAPVSQVLEEIDAVWRGKGMIFFVDDNFASDPDKALELCKALRGKGIRWVSQASNTTAWTPGLLDAMRESGCLGVLIGLESLDEQTLIGMHKRFNTLRGGHVETLARFREAGLCVYGTFIFGNDGDTPDVFGETVDFAMDQGLFIAAFNHITPFPGTPLYARLQAENRLVYDAWWLDEGYRYNEIPYTPLGMSREELEAGCLNARKRFYSWPGIAHRYRRHPILRRGLWMRFNYWMINAMHQKDTVGRSGMPLGDRNDPRPLLEVGGSET